MQARPEKGNAPVIGPTEALSEANPYQKESNVSNSTQVAASRAISVPFHGANLSVVEHNGQPYTPMKPIVDGIGLDWKSQHRKVASNQARWGMVIMTMPLAQGGSQDENTQADSLHGQVDHAGQRRALTCIPVRKVAAWLATVEPGKVKDVEVRARVVQYQNECDDVLWQYWTEGIAINPRKGFAVNPGDLLTKDQAETLRLMLKSAVERLPKAKQGGAMVKGWSKLKAHFGVPYREIPRHEFSEAVSIIARHTAEWELVEDTPALEVETTSLRATVEAVRRLENGDWGMKVVCGEMGFGVRVPVKAMRAGGVKVGDLIRLEYPKESNPLGGEFVRVTLWHELEEHLAKQARKDWLPDEQAKEVLDRLGRLCKMFHPESSFHEDARGVMRALLGADAKTGFRRSGFRQVIPSLGLAA